MQKIRNIGGHILAICSTALLITTCFLAFIPILFIGIFKLFPNKKWQDLCTALIEQISIVWCDFNNFYVDRILKVRTEISGMENFNKKEWYLVIANHQSWVDIVILHKLLNRKIPVLKFFVKDQLKWIPFLGFSWWAMGCPFMKRYSKEYIAKNPHKKGKDLLSTQKAMEAFKRMPSSIMNFVEGTRFTDLKKDFQNSPYNHLLKPKAGGISFIMSSMGQQIKSILDVTIIYPEKKHSLWDFMSKRVKSVKINVRQLPIPPHFTSMKALTDSKTQAEFKDWLNSQWRDKDNLIAELK